MGRYTAEANTTLHLDDGQVVSPGETFETVFRPEQEASLLACGAIVIDVDPAALGTVVGAEAGAIAGAPQADVQPAGDPGVKE